MNRLVGTELESLGRRLRTELDVALLSPVVRAALTRLARLDTTERIQRGPDALKINGYL